MKLINALDGWKTIIGSTILFGLGAFLLYHKKWDDGARLIGEGMIALGIGHKVEKGFRAQRHKDGGHGK